MKIKIIIIAIYFTKKNFETLSSRSFFDDDDDDEDTTRWRFEHIIFFSLCKKFSSKVTNFFFHFVFSSSSEKKPTNRLLNTILHPTKQSYMSDVLIPIRKKITPLFVFGHGYGFGLYLIQFSLQKIICNSKNFLFL